MNVCIVPHSHFGENLPFTNRISVYLAICSCIMDENILTFLEIQPYLNEVE